MRMESSEGVLEHEALMYPKQMEAHTQCDTQTRQMKGGGGDKSSRIVVVQVATHYPVAVKTASNVSVREPCM